MIQHADSAAGQRHSDRRDPRQSSASLPRSVRAKVRATWLSLLWERVWPVVAPGLGIVLLFLGVALTDLLPALSASLHGTVLALFAVALAGVAFWALKTLSMPHWHEAERRLEIDNALQHRPVATLSDRLPEGTTPDADTLFALHRQRALRALTGLRAGVPRFKPLDLMPVLVRVALAMLLAIGMASAGSDAGIRVARALQPGFGSDIGAAMALDVWITPPGYTGAPPIFLSGGALPGISSGPTGAGAGVSDPAAVSTDPDPIRVPYGSLVLAQVQGDNRPPTLELAGETLPFESVEDGVFRTSAPIESGDRLAIVRGGADLAAWPIEVVPDMLPVIDFASVPTTTERHALRLLFRVSDDYGVDSAMAVIRRSPDEGALSTAPDSVPEHAETRDIPAANLDDGPVETVVEEETLQLPLILPGPGTRDHTGAHYTDLTAHPWAGTPVLMRLEVTDAAEQTGRSEEIPLMLPERIFNHPVARAVAEQRKRLTTEPEARSEIAKVLRDLQGRPRRYFDDFTVFLALRSAARRLIYTDTPEAVEEVQELLWDIALRIEDGEVSITSRDLREAQQALRDALASNAPDAEIERLMDELAQAIDRFLQAMQDQMAQMSPEGMQPIDPQVLENTRMVNRQDLMDMLERAREMARAGARNAAREMLSQLQNMLENLQNMPMQDPRTQQAMEMMRNLQGLTERQRELLERTFRDAQREGQQGRMGRQQDRQPGQQQDRQSGGQQNAQAGNQPATAAEQEALRRMLGETMRRLGDMTGQIPDSLGQAERSMRDAGRSLGRGQPGEAVPHQSDALDRLQQGMRSMAEQMMPAMGRMPGGPQQSDPMPRLGEGRDPLGRHIEDNGFGAGNDVEIPTESDIQRARDILRELHRRAGQPDRSPMERDYIDRLLDRF